ncbi:tetraketide alpha-pyrone reductase 2 [Aegilops tauschii subsp. strangulata]|uniref:NAD-dependent epimerase/dehydratase domain-containing protein n=3 Tax=Aegilops tauschii TaxID=37682 RepID=A0A453DST2_AEGTS|nr:tetraketide alpha-pyrone reductase 2 [Aegilops tauschii subsp. strangulata]
MPEYCVTGGTGFIASHLIRALLAAGHTVRATVRDPSDEAKVGFLWELEGADERLQLLRADLLVEGSFDAAVSGVDGVFHAASPVVVSYEDGKDAQEKLVDPIMKGAGNVLRSCARAAVPPRRVVFTSSCSCVRYRHHHVHGGAPPALNESHWSDADYCRTYGLWYAYAKTVAEKEAWRLATEHGLDLVVVNPSFVVGPVLGRAAATSTALVVLALLNGDLGKYPNTTIGFVHVDDVVLGHVLAMEDGRASGRLICSGDVAHWSEVLGSLRERYPQYPIPTECSGGKGDDRAHKMDTSKMEALGFPPFLSIQQMFDDCIKSFQEKGLLLP